MIELALGPARVVWTDRHGGVSAAPYHTANLANGDDDPAAVAENRRRLAAQLGTRPPQEWWWLHQEHGATVVVAEGCPPVEPPVADAAVTARRGAPMVVLTADCASVALASHDAAGVVHAGWRGLLAGVVQETVARLRTLGRGEVRAALGPCIRAARYEFGRPELDRVVARLGSSVESRTASGAPALDLPAAVRRALEEAGVRSLVDVGECTATSPDHFSYRRDGETGRQGLVVVLGR